MKTFFSIVLPTYNRAQLIAKAIESVIAQTFPSWELIIVDDGSTDNTKNIVEKYSQQEKRIKYFYQQNSERSAARNNGIKNSSGAYICFLDSDDYFLPNRLELLFNELEKRNFQIAAFFTGLRIEKNGIISIKVLQPPIGNILEYVALNSIHSQQTCIHHSILNGFKYDTQFRIGEDLELWIRIANKFPFIFLENQATVVVVDHDERSVNVKQNNVYYDTLRLCKHIFNNEQYGNQISKKTQAKIIGNCYYGMVKYYIHSDNRIKAILFMAKSISTDMNTPLLKFRINVLLKLFFGVALKKIESLVE